MSNETVKQETNTESMETENKTFTQEEVDRIIGERLGREKAKFADYDDLKEKAAKFDEIEEANKTELQKATEKAESLQAELDSLKKAEEIRLMKEAVSTETGVPVALITATEKEAAMEQANAIKQYADPGHPTVRDAGEVTHTKKQSTREQFSDWFEKQF